MVDAINGMQQALTGGKVSPRQEAEDSRQTERSAEVVAPSGLKVTPLGPEQARPEPAEGNWPQGQGQENLAERAARELAETQPFFRPELEFKVDEESGRTVITVYHPKTEEVIRQIPPEQALKLAQLLREQQEEGSGVDAVSLIDTRA